MRFPRRSSGPDIRIRCVCVVAGWLTACMGSVATGPSAPPTDSGTSAPSTGGAAGPQGPGATSGPGTAPSAPAAPDSCTPAPRRLWKLTPAQYGRSVAALFPAVADARSGSQRPWSVDRTFRTTRGN